MSDEFEDDNEDELLLCWKCVGDDYLKNDIRQNGVKAVCDFCETKRACITIGELADRIEVAFEEHYNLTPSEPSSMEWTMMKEGDYDWERRGEEVIYAIQEAAGIEEKPAQLALKILQDRHYDIELAQMGESGPFDDDAHYEDKGANVGELHADWAYLENSLRTEARHFNKIAESILDKVFEGLAELKSANGNSVIETLEPNGKTNSLYRARVFQSEKQLEEALKRPDLHLGPPPSRLATAGRLNAHGIAMFYGATNQDIAIAEVRPPVGSEVLLGRFEMARPLKVLNVEALQAVFESGSVFDPGFIRRLERAKFLEHISRLFSRPVLPDDAPLNYLITQAIADYLASQSEPVFDGVMYASAQTQTKGMNVALFHQASRVKEIELVKGSTLEASLGYHDEDGWYRDFSVWEHLPPEKAEEEKPEEPWPMFEPALEFPWQGNFDTRNVSLTLDLKSIRVHLVTAAKFETNSHSVRRYQRKHDDKQYF